MIKPKSKRWKELEKLAKKYCMEHHLGIFQGIIFIDETGDALIVSVDQGSMFPWHISKYEYQNWRKEATARINL